MVLNRKDRRTLTGKLGLVRNATPVNRTTEGMYYEGLLENNRTATTDVNQDGLASTLNLLGIFNLKNGQRIEAALNGNYTDNDYRRNYAEGDFASHTKVNETMYNLDGSFMYYMPLKHKNSFTLRLYHFHKVSSSDYEGDTQEWQHLWSAETLLFGQYDQRFGNKVSLFLRPGVSMLNYRVHGHDRISQLSPRFNFNTAYQPNQHHYLEVGLNVGNTYPLMSLLNSTEQVIDELQIQRGNPSMEYCHLYNPSLAYAFQTKRFNTVFSAIYQYADNVVVNNYSVENGRLVNSFQDGGKEHTLIFYFSTTWKANENLSVQADLNFIRSILDGDISMNQSTLLGSLKVNYYWKDFSFNVHGDLPYRMTDAALSRGYVKVHGNYGAFAGWSRRGWRVEAGVNNIFTGRNKLSKKMTDAVYRYDMSQTARSYQRTGYVKVAYTFDFGKKTSRDNRNINTNIDSAILKAE